MWQLVCVLESCIGRTEWQLVLIRYPCRFQGQAHSHAEVLGRFERDLRLLSSVNILPAAQTQQYKCLGDLVPEEQYSDWATKCSATHDNLVKRVRCLALMA